MSTATRRVCDSCHGVIPGAAQAIENVAATLSLSSGTQSYNSLDFCCTAHMAAYFQSQPLVPVPAPLYPTLP